MLPFVIAAMTMSHIVLLHHSGSSNPLGVNRNLDKSPFSPYFTSKDIVGVLCFFAILSGVVFWFS